MQSKEETDPEELLSAAFDGELRGASSLSDERRSKLEAEWSWVGAEIRSLPVESVDLVTAVRSERPQAAHAESVCQHQFVLRRRTWLTVASVAAVLIFVTLPLLRDRGVGADRESADIDRSLLADVGLDNHPSPASYNLVVVNIAENVGVEATVDKMLGAAKERGAEITSLHTEVDESAEYSAGFLLTAGRESQMILDSLADNQQELEWNPADIDGRSHEEIKAIFLASMKVPTKSDRVFGSMYVVDEVNREVFVRELPDDRVESMPSIALAEPEDAVSRSVDAEKRADSVTDVRPGDAATAPLIVIFRKQVSDPAAADPEQGKVAQPIASRLAA